MNDINLLKDVGQLFQISLPQEKKSSWRKLIEDIRPGSIVIQGANVSRAQDIKTFIKKVSSICLDAGIPQNRMPLMGITQEGGWISRIDDIANSPGNMALGACDGRTSTYSSYRAMSEELRMCGIQWNLAPTVDINTEVTNPIIGVRSFGDNTENVSRHTLYAIEGLRDGGILSCAKHFPGHGASKSDSHITLPEIGKEMRELEKVDLQPYYAAIRNNVDSIMISHIYFPHIEKNGIPVPASLSRRVVTDLLRNRMGYNGLILTDSLSMAAVADNFPMETAAVMAIEAGVDVLECAVPEKYLELHSGLMESVKSRQVKRGRIVESLVRFRELRRILKNIGTNARPWSPALRNHVSGLSTFSAITEINSMNGFRLPAPGAGRVHTVFFSRSRFLEEKQVLKSESPATRAVTEWGLQPGMSLQLPRSIETSKAVREAKNLSARAGKTDAAVVFVNDALSVQSKAGVSSQIAFVREVASRMRGKVAVVGTGTPYEASLLGKTPYIAAYSYRHDALLASIGVLIGAVHARGHLPVTIRNRPE
jgi:beta-N-acetylhexosaminidase